MKERKKERKNERKWKESKEETGRVKEWNANEKKNICRYVLIIIMVVVVVVVVEMNSGEGDGNCGYIKQNVTLFDWTVT